MHLTGVTLVLLVVQIGAAAADNSPLERLQARLPINSVENLSPGHLAGEYSHPPRELGVGLSGNDLYLFTDGTYVYDEWADVEPLVVRDKGKWQVVNGVIVLSSDNEVKWDPGVERRYIAVYRHSNDREIFLVGTNRALADFEQNAGDQPTIQFLVVAKARSRLFKNQDEAMQIKKKLMLESWHQSYFEAGNQ